MREVVSNRKKDSDSNYLGIEFFVIIQIFRGGGVGGIQVIHKCLTRMTEPCRERNLGGTSIMMRR